MCFYASTVELTTRKNLESDSTLVDEPWVVMRIVHRDHTDKDQMFQEAVFTAAEWKAMIDAAVIANH